MARPSKLSRLSIEQIHAEIKRRQQSVGPLQRRRAALAAQLAAVDAELAALGSTEAAPAKAGRPAEGRRRATNAVSLPQALHAAMKGKHLSIADGFRGGSRGRLQDLLP